MKNQTAAAHNVSATANSANPTASVSLSEIVAARSRLNGAINYTQCPESAALSELTGARIFCKQEFLQRTGSFKERGARNALAWHGRALGIAVTVVMPRFAPLVKVARCRQFGATVILHGDTYDQARSEADRLAAEHISATSIPSMIRASSPGKASSPLKSSNKCLTPKP
jgi:threonine dehydratase